MRYIVSGLLAGLGLTRALNKLSICLRHAAALGLDVDLQATDKARALLGKQRHTPKNIPSMPWQDVPAFYQSLSEGSVTELALRLLILRKTYEIDPARHKKCDALARNRETGVTKNRTYMDIAIGSREMTSFLDGLQSAFSVFAQSDVCGALPLRPPGRWRRGHGAQAAYPT
jgi:hypothetical protein